MRFTSKVKTEQSRVCNCYSVLLRQCECARVGAFGLQCASRADDGRGVLLVHGDGHEDFVRGRDPFALGVRWQGPRGLQGENEDASSFRVISLWT